MKVQSSVRARLCGVAFLMALAAGCGGGGEDGTLAQPPAPPSSPPAAPPPAAEVRGWANPFGSAAVVIGQSNFNQLEPDGGPATRMKPEGASAVTPDGKLLVAGSGVISVFSSPGTVNGPTAELQIGLVHEGNGVNPNDISTRGNNVVVTSVVSNLVLVYNGPLSDGLAPVVTAGEFVGSCSPSTLNNPRSAYLTPNGRLIVADNGNNRVSIWDDVDQATGPLGQANIVLGQSGMNTCEPNADGSPNSATLSGPSSVWSDGVKLIVADTGNNRVLIWNDITDVDNFQEADVVIGQQNDSETAANRGQDSPSEMSLAAPTGVDVSGQGELAVTDSGNSRVLVWRTVPTTSNVPADFVVGQSDFTHGAANDPGQRGQSGKTLSAKTLSLPAGARFDGRDLIVNDYGNDRVLIWRESN